MEQIQWKLGTKVALFALEHYNYFIPVVYQQSSWWSILTPIIFQTLRNRELTYLSVNILIFTINILTFLVPYLFKIIYFMLKYLYVLLLLLYKYFLFVFLYKIFEKICPFVIKIFKKILKANLKAILKLTNQENEILKMKSLKKGKRFLKSFFFIFIRFFKQF